MVAVSVAFSLALAVLTLGLRTGIHIRRTGHSPLRNRAGVGGAMTIVGLGVAFAAGPVLDGVAGASQWFGGRSVAIVGISAASLGLALSVWSQFAMGSSWRIGVDPAERTALVTGGPFRYVRNPIYTGTVLFMIGLFLLVPNAASLIALVVVAVMLDLQVRRIEEPFLAESHGYEYRRYIAEAGRFIPRVSRFPPRRANR